MVIIAVALALVAMMALTTPATAANFDFGLPELPPLREVKVKTRPFPLISLLPSDFLCSSHHRLYGSCVAKCTQPGMGGLEKN
jgi:hypothetical protein